jgi:hypothetical protein
MTRTTQVSLSHPCGATDDDDDHHHHQNFSLGMNGIQNFGYLGVEQN